MEFTPLGFGKHKDKTLPQIVFSDLDYFIWAFGENVFKSRALKKKKQIMFITGYKI